VPEEAAADDARPTFHWNRDRYEWLMAHRDRWNDTDRAFVAHYTASSDYALLREVFEADGIAWTGGDVPAGFRAAV
jgi:putative transposase